MAQLQEEKQNYLPAPLFRLLEEMQCGYLNPLAIERGVKEVRAKEVGLSPHRDIDPPSRAEISCMAIDEVENRYLICGYADGSTAIIDVEESPSPAQTTFPTVIYKHKEESHQFGVTGVAWYPQDTGLYVTGSFDQTVKVWDANKEQVAYTFQMPEKIYSLNMQSNSTKHNLVAVGSGDRRAYLCDLVSGAKTHSLHGHLGPVNVVAWANRDFFLATGGVDGTLRMWDIRKTQSCLAILSQDQEPRIRKRNREQRDFETNSDNMPIAHLGGVSAICFSPSGRHMLSSGADTKLCSWNPSSFEREIVNYGTFPQSHSRAYKRVQIAVSWHANIVYHPRRQDIIACDIITGQRIACLSAHLDTVKCCVTQPRGETLFSGGKDSNILIWTPPAVGFGPDTQEDPEGAAGEDNWSDED